MSSMLPTASISAAKLLRAFMSVRKVGHSTPVSKGQVSFKLRKEMYPTLETALKIGVHCKSSTMGSVWASY